MASTVRAGVTRGHVAVEQRLQALLAEDALAVERHDAIGALVGTLADGAELLCSIVVVERLGDCLQFDWPSDDATLD